MTVSSDPPGPKLAVPMVSTVVPHSTSRLARVRPPTVMLTVCELAAGAVAVTGMCSSCGVADEHAASTAAAPPATAAAPQPRAASRPPGASSLPPQPPATAGQPAHRELTKCLTTAQIQPTMPTRFPETW